MLADQLARNSDHQSDWAQVSIEVPVWDAAPIVIAEHVRPVLPAGRWWFLRKHPCWRLRYQPSEPDPLPAHLADLAAAGTIRSWTTSVYEPETHAFGGPAAMITAHTLFCADSAAALDRLPVGTRRAEISLLALTRLLRGASLEPYEQGDVWDHVVQMRPAANPTGAATHGAAAAVQRLLALDTRPAADLVRRGPLAPLAGWLNAFTTAGSQLAEHAAAGHLTRGLRAVIAYHVLHHWNRHNIPSEHQHHLAVLSRETLLPLYLTPPR